MKTNPSLKIFKLSTLVPLGIAIAAALVTQPLYADDIVNNIVITENSSMSLTATYNGSTSGVAVTLQGSDQWQVNFPATVSFGSTGRNVGWIEPKNSSLENAVSFFPEVSSVLGISSDAVTNPSFSPTPDESTIINVGFDSRGGSISATFDDDGEAPAVPETGSTFGLLSLSLIGLLGGVPLSVGLTRVRQSHENQPFIQNLQILDARSFSNRNGGRTDNTANACERSP